MFKQKLLQFWYSWRFYSLEKPLYIQCMERVFADNLTSLCQSTLTVVILAAFSAIFPMVLDNDPAAAALFIAVAFVSAIVCFIAHSKKKKPVSKGFIYTLIIIYYTNIMLFGVYLGVWSNTENYAVMFIGFIITVPLLFVISPILKLCLNVGALIFFSASALLFKDPAYSIDDTINASIACVIGLVFGWLIPKYKLITALHLSELEQHVYLDPLTGIYNRRYLDENLNRVIQSLSRSDGTLSLLMVDIDYFKKYNDTYGHDAGDICLKIVAEILSKSVNRTDDFVARYGGEEFTVVLPHTDEKGALMVAERMLEAVRKSNIPHKKSEVTNYVTLSIGIVAVKTEHAQSACDFIKSADKMLYKSKKSGRNRYSFSTTLTGA